MRIRVMTYNVHRCVGLGGGDSTGDIGALCEEARADVIALQELDAPETDEAAGAHHARDLASRLGMTLLFCRTFRRGVGFYGHALLCRSPLELKRVTTFPALPGAHHEPRGAIWARATFPGARTLDIVSTHLGLSRAERRAQATELLGSGWLAAPEHRSPTVLCGDFNSIPAASTTYRRFTRRFVDAQVGRRHRPRPTFPSLFPVFRIDHVFVSRGVTVLGVRVPWDARARRASDHLPLIVDLSL